jgi:hypothetical protein
MSARDALDAHSRKVRDRACERHELAPSRVGAYTREDGQTIVLVPATAAKLPAGAEPARSGPGWVTYFVPAGETEAGA